MTGALFIVSIISLLTAAAVTLAIAGFVLQRVQKYVELAEERIETLREGQECLQELLEENRANIKESEEPDDAVVEAEFVFEDQNAGDDENVEQRIRRLELEIQALRESRQVEKVWEKVSSSGREGIFISLPNDQEALVGEKTALKDMPDQRKDIRAARTARAGRSAETMESGQTVDPGGQQERVAKRLHPDDIRGYSRNNIPAKKMFSEHYDRYLENYSGYVELAEEIYRMRSGGETSFDYPAQQEWKQKLGRAKDGIDRTAARLDILEQYNPELASDHRIFHRAEIAQSHAKLEKKLSALTDS